MHSSHHSPVTRVVTPEARLTLELPDESATIAFAREISPLLSPGMVIWLDGDLGTGKTTLVRAVLGSAGHMGPVKSPTYTLVEVYLVSSIYWYHFDFYRFSEPEEFEDAGLGEYFRSDSICLVEWPGNAAGYVPAADLVLRIRFADEGPGSGRCLALEATSAMGQRCLSNLESRWRVGAG